MNKKVVSIVILTLLFIGMLTMAFNILRVKASGIIYVRADGSVDPPTANITSVDNVTYSFTDNNYYEIVVERDNIVVDGAGYTLQGTGSGKGIYLENRRNVTIKNMEIRAFGYGIWLDVSSNNIISGNDLTNNVHCVLLYEYSSNNTVSGNNITNHNTGVRISLSFNNNISGNNITNNYCGVRIYGSSSNNTVSGNTITNHTSSGVHLLESSNNNISRNNITNNHYGILLESSSDNTVSGNNITNNDYGARIYASNNNNISGNTIINNDDYGIWFSISSNNKFHHNNFINNTQQVYFFLSSRANVWDNGYPSGGNYWSDYTGFDLYSGPDQDQVGGDGIGDTSYSIDGNNIDHYPLVSPFPQTTDFDIVVIPSTGTIALGTTKTTNVYVSAIAGYDYLVSLSASGQPEGVTINFNPNSGTPGFASTMTVQVGYSVPPNVYPITVTGLGSDGKTHSTTYTLTVTSSETYDLTITTTGGGTTNPTPGIHTYDAGAVAVVSAIPDMGYLFDHWELDGNNVGATNPISVTMNNDHTLHAVFFYTGPSIPEYPAADISIVAATFGFLAAFYLILKRKKQAHSTAAATDRSKA